MPDSSQTNPNAPLQYFNPSTGRWEPSSSQQSSQNWPPLSHAPWNVQNQQQTTREPPSPATSRASTPTPSPVGGPLRVNWNTTDVKAEQLNQLANKYVLPETPTGYGVSSFEETGMGLNINYVLVDVEAAIKAGTVSSEFASAYRTSQAKTAQNTAAWSLLGYSQYGGKYEAPDVPSGYKISKVTEGGAGLNIEFELTTETKTRAETIGANLLSGKAQDIREVAWLSRDFPEYMESLQTARASGARAEVIGANLLSGKAQNISEVAWLSKNYPDYMEQLQTARGAGKRAEVIGANLLSGKAQNIGEVAWLSKNYPEYMNSLSAVKTSKSRVKAISESYLTGSVDIKEIAWLSKNYPDYTQGLLETKVSKNAWAALGYPQYGGKYTSPEVPSGFKIGKITESGMGLNIEMVAAIDVAARLVKSIKEPHGAEVGGSQIYDTSKNPQVITLAPSFTTMATYFGKRGQTIETKPMDINPIIESFVGAPSQFGVRGQTISTKSMDVLVAKPEVTESIIQAMTTTRADILHGQGLELPPKSASMALADYGVVGEALGGFISPIDNLVLLVGKFARNPTMEKVMYNPTAFGVPVQAATSFFTGALTGKPIERASVNAQAQFLREHPVYAGASVAGDIFLGWVSGKVIGEVGGKVGGKVSSMWEDWRYGKAGSEKFLSSIEKGTIVNPETGVTSYSGFAAKQASRFAPQISSLPFGTPKSLPGVLKNVSEETGVEALDFAWGLGTTPKTTMFSVTKLADPAYIRPSLPVYQMIGGSLVNVSEMVTSWGDPNAKFKMFPETKTPVESTSIQSDFEQLGFKDVISPKETPFIGFKDLNVGYSGSATQKLYMKASNVLSEVKNMLSDTGSATRMEMVFNKPSTSFVETTVQGISAGISLPSTKLVGAKAISESVVLPLLGSYRGTAAEKEYVKAQNEMYGKTKAPSRITIDTKLSSVFAFPTSVGAFPVIPDISMSRQGTRLETKQADIEEYSVLTKLFQSQAGESAYKTPTLQVQQLVRLKPSEGTTYIPKIADYLGEREREGLGLIPFFIPEVGTRSIPLPITAQVPLVKQASIITPTLDIPTRLDFPTPNITTILPPNFGRLSIGGGGGRAGGFGFKRFGGVLRKWPVRAPKDVFAMSVKQMRAGMTYGSKVHPAMRGVQKGPTIRQPRRRRSRGRRR